MLYEKKNRGDCLDKIPKFPTFAGNFVKCLQQTSNICVKNAASLKSE